MLGEFSSFADGTWRFHLNLVEGSVPEEGAIFGPPLRDGSWPDVFMLMPFEPELEPVFRDHVVNVASELNFNASRGDDLFSNRSIVQDIWSAIHNARVIIADCTGRNANVFYEIGIAHSIGKDTVLIAQTMEDVPFDLRHLRVIIYKFTPRGMHEFESKLKTALETLASGRVSGS
jgi:hypothetical protein